jgi:hypothetical protein
LSAFLGTAVTLGVGWVVTRVPELAPYQGEIISTLAGILGITIVSQNVNQGIKTIKK